MTLSPGRGLRSQPKSAANSAAYPEHFMSTRTLAISALSLVLAVAAGAGAGIPAGLAVAADVHGQALPIIVGILSGVAAACLAALTVAGCLHSLVAKR